MKKNHVLLEYDGGDGDVGVYEMAVTKDKLHDKRVKMWYSKEYPGWCHGVGGTTCMELHEDGDGVWVKLPSGEKHFYDFSDIEYLSLILEYYHKYSGLDQWKPRERWWSKKAYKKWKKKSLKHG